MKERMVMIMPDLRLGIQFQPNRWWYTLVACPEEAYSAIKELLIPHPDEIKEGLLFRRLPKFRLQEQANWDWREWQGENGERFEEFYENMDDPMNDDHDVAYEQEMIADGDIPTVR